MLPEELTFTFKPRRLLKAFLFTPVPIIVGFAATYLPWSSPNTPAWVQAFGALVGIGVAIYVPWYQKFLDRKDRALVAYEHELARCDHLMVLCWELNEAVQGFWGDALCAEYIVSNAMQSSVLKDLLQRLNSAQEGDLNLKRMEAAKEMRYEIFYWLKLFDHDEEIEYEELWKRFKVRQPKLDGLVTAAENIGRLMRGLPPYDLERYRHPYNDE